MKQISRIAIGYLILKSVLFFGFALFGSEALPPWFTAGFGLIWLMVAALIWWAVRRLEKRQTIQQAPPAETSRPLPTAAHDLQMESSGIG